MSRCVGILLEGTTRGIFEIRIVGSFSFQALASSSTGIASRLWWLNLGHGISKSGASAEVTVNGSLFSVDVTSGGTGYSSSPLVSIVGGGGFVFGDAFLE